VPVVEEDLEVGKRAVQSGGVRIYKRVTEKPVEESVNLRQEHVTVERRPADRPATAADLDAQDRTIEVTETVEKPVISKEARVVEEVVVGKDVDQRTETVRDTVRRTDVQVEQLGARTAAAYDTYAPDFRRHFQTTYASNGTAYDQFEPAYRYGYDLADRYRGRDWADVEADARRDWEQRHAGTWDRFRGAVRYAWDRAATAAPGSREPGVQTGGRTATGTPDTRGIMEKASDAVTGDRIDDKTGQPV